MRFFSNGPDIPDDLLMQRDRGKVVLICGAGVSVPSGMPDFVCLTKHVIDYFDPPENSKIRKAFKPWLRSDCETIKTTLDHIFDCLYDEYSDKEVHRVVTERLSADNDVDSSKHRLLLEISSNVERKPRIVTTNFDRLFERTNQFPEKEIFYYPRLPDIQINTPIAGITYLHGRLKEPEEAQYNYVLSRGEFGHAYLSGGLATRFICQLVKSYTVVFIGYKAEDPPMEYLLQGLRREDAYKSAGLYAFDKGQHTEVAAKWVGKGVEVISYKDHDVLWETIEAWAKRATDPEQWNKEVILIAQKNPKEVAPHERGQIAHVIDTEFGAKLFANADPLPSAEWLHVFDASCRITWSQHHAERRQALEYALDDEIPGAAEEGSPDSRRRHFLGWRPGDEKSTDPLSLDRFVSGAPGGLPIRLEYFIQWIVKSISSPTTALWAARVRHMHPRLLSLLRVNLVRQEDLCSDAWHVWSLLLEHHEDQRRSSWDHVWHDIEDMAKKEGGWTDAAIRYFEKMAAPSLAPEVRSLPSNNDLSTLSWQELLSNNDILEWKMRFPDHGKLEITVPDEKLPILFKIAEQHFIRAMGFIKKSGTYWPGDLLTCYPEREVQGAMLEMGVRFRFEWFLGLFQQMLNGQPKLLKGHALTWPKDDVLFFGRLHLYALSKDRLFSAEEAARTLACISDRIFWDRHHRRELLFLIEDRWEHFSDELKSDLIRRIVNGSGE